MRKRQADGRRFDDSRYAVDGRAAADVGIELWFSAQPGPIFVLGSAYYVPAEVVSGMRHMLTRMVASDQWPRAVALTSALRGEGVSYTALALSGVLSQDTTSSVCLVDANWYWPHVGVRAGAVPVEVPAGAGPARASGLAGVLGGELALDDALVRVHGSTSVDEPSARAGSLMLLPAGQLPHGGAASSWRVIAARSPEMKATIAALRERFEYIVLDVPAVLATSDAIALAGLADACCLVVHQGVTPAAVVQEALAAIRHLPVMGAIMNHVRVHMPAGLAGQLTAPLVNGASQAAG